MDRGERMEGDEEGDLMKGRVPPLGGPGERNVNDGIRDWTFRLLPGFSFAPLSPAAPAVPPYLCGYAGVGFHRRGDQAKGL